jgi:hypothetical protein
MSRLLASRQGFGAAAPGNPLQVSSVPRIHKVRRRNHCHNRNLNSICTIYEQASSHWPESSRRFASGLQHAREKGHENICFTCLCRSPLKKKSKSSSSRTPTAAPSSQTSHRSGNSVDLGSRAPTSTYKTPKAQCVLLLLSRFRRHQAVQPVIHHALAVVVIGVTNGGGPYRRAR